MLSLSEPLFFGAITNAPALWTILPFLLLLISIAAMSFVNKAFWNKYYPHIAVGLAAIIIFYYLVIEQDWHVLAHSALEYFSFMALVGSLFITAGGIHIKVEGRAKPWVNCLFLAVGAGLSNFIGTTGASMLLIRPWIRMNQTRIHPYQIIFFIFIVSNCGGCLTPIGDPPLFLGFLKGVPFFWCLVHLWDAWLVMNVSLLIIYFFVDSRTERKTAGANDPAPGKMTWELSGLHNLFFIALILVGIFTPTPWRELIMIASGLLSYFCTPKKIHQANQFNFHPIEEVGWLFLGIFVTMIPALHYLKIHTADFSQAGQGHYFYACSLFSGLLDNAPTYLTFLTTAFAGSHLDINRVADVTLSLEKFPDIVIAISLSAVFGGALTYIGNGPNFMVKVIAEQSNIRMPGFFGYVLSYSLPVLVPLLILIGWIFVH